MNDHLKCHRFWTGTLIAFLFLFTFTCLAGLSASATAQEKTETGAKPTIEVVARYGKSIRASMGGQRVLLLRGTPRERGKAHGYLMATDLIVCFNALLPMIQMYFQGKDFQKEIIPLGERFTWPKRYEEELEGIMEGLREAIPKKEGRMIKSFGREIQIGDFKFYNSFPDFQGFGCSSFSAWGKLTTNGELMIARNLDYVFGAASNIIPYCIIAIEPEEEGLKKTIDISMIGVVGVLTVMNEEGVFCAMHDESGLKGTNETFFSRGVGIRNAAEKARASTAIEDAAEVLRKHPTIFGANVHVAAPLGPDPESPTNLPAILEWDGNAKDKGVTVRKVKRTEARSALFCTNHYRSRATRFGKCSRYAKIREAAAEHIVSGKPIDVERAKEILDSVAPSGQGVTLYAVIAWPKTRKMALATSPAPFTPATKGTWIEFSWEDIFSLR